MIHIVKIQGTQSVAPLCNALKVSKMPYFDVPEMGPPDIDYYFAIKGAPFDLAAVVENPTPKKMGTLVAVLRTSISHSRGMASLHYITVAKAYRRKGVAVQLLTKWMSDLSQLPTPVRIHRSEPSTKAPASFTRMVGKMLCQHKFSWRQCIKGPKGYITVESRDGKPPVATPANP